MFTGMVLRNVYYESTSPDEIPTHCYANMRVWIFDFKGGRFSFHFEKVGDNLTNHLKPPYRAQNIDQALAMLKDFIQMNLFNLAGDYREYLKTVNLDLVFQTKD